MFLAAWVSLAQAHIPTFLLATPDDWCDVVQGALGGDYIQFTPGDYFGPCTIVGQPNALYPGDYTTLLALDPYDLPRIHHDGVSDFILDVSGTHLLVTLMDFPVVPEGVTAIRLHDGDDLWARYISTAVVNGTLVHVDSGATTTRIGELTALGGTGTVVEVGCRLGCELSDAEVSFNLMTGVHTGIRFHPGASGLIHDNAIAWGNVAVDFAGGGALLSTVELSLFQGSAQALHVTDGPVMLRNLALFDGLTQLSGDDVTATGLTVLGPLEGAGLISPARLRNTAINSATFPTLAKDVDGGGNIACADKALCWLDADAWDIYPVQGGPLANTGVEDADLLGDWCKHARGDFVSPGAFESIGSVGVGPLLVVSRYLFDCRLPEETEVTTTTTPTDTGLPGVGGATGSTRPPIDTGDAPGQPPPLPIEPRCGCISGGSSTNLTLVALVFTMRRRKSPGRQKHFQHTSVSGPTLAR